MGTEAGNNGWRQATKYAVWMAVGLIVFVGVPEGSRWINGGAFGQPNPNAIAQVSPPSVYQNSTGDCSPNIYGSGNTTNCNTLPVVSASAQSQQQTGNSDMPWRTVFYISTTGLVWMGSRGQAAIDGCHPSSVSSSEISSPSSSLFMASSSSASLLIGSTIFSLPPMYCSYITLISP